MWWASAFIGKTVIFAKKMEFLVVHIIEMVEFLGEVRHLISVY